MGKMKTKLIKCKLSRHPFWMSPPISPGILLLSFFTLEVYFQKAIKVTDNCSGTFDFKFCEKYKLLQDLR